MIGGCGVDLFGESTRPRFVGVGLNGGERGGSGGGGNRGGIDGPLREGTRKEGGIGGSPGVTLDEES